jgi:hypothetical protein
MTCVRILAPALALVAFAFTGALAEEPFPLTGTYVQGKACKGDGTDARALTVTITDTEIHHRQGVCTIADKRVEGDKLTLNATCKMRSGNVMSGDVTFTRRDAQTLDMVDQDETYKTVLHRCP